MCIYIYIYIFFFKSGWSRDYPSHKVAPPLTKRGGFLNLNVAKFSLIFSVCHILLPNFLFFIPFRKEKKKKTNLKSFV